MLVVVVAVVVVVVVVAVAIVVVHLVIVFFYLVKFCWTTENVWIGKHTYTMYACKTNQEFLCWLVYCKCK